jgi:membrane fusion protein, epimerase transport system
MANIAQLDRTTLVGGRHDAAICDVERAASPRRQIASGVFCLAVLSVTLAAWAALAPLSGAVIGVGHVKVDMDRKTVQHPEGGIVAEIRVRDGSRVRAGDTLLVLGDTRVGADADQLRAQLDAELARQARFSAEEAGMASVGFPAELTDRADEPRVAALMGREQSIFATRQHGLRNQLALLQAQVAETRRELAARRAQVAADDLTLEHHVSELEVNRSLAARGFVSKLRLSALERAVAEFESRKAMNRAELSRSQQKIVELELRSAAVRSQFEQEASVGHQQASTSVVSLRERMRPAVDAELRQRIIAPVDGEVVGLAVTSVGAVLGPRERILDIVPVDPDLVFEARLRPEDIGYALQGSMADVRLTGLKQRLTPTVTGEVTYVSADRLLDASTRAPYYLAHVRVPAEQIARLGHARLTPGMPAEIYIRTGSRTALEYLLDPFLGFLNRSMREQ